MSIYSALVISKTPALYYRLGELTGTAVTDSSGNGHTGTYTGGFTLGQPGPLVADTDTCVLFNGTTGIASAGVAGIDITATDWTLEAWVYPTAFGAGHRGVIGTDGGHSYCLTVVNGAMRITNVNVADATAATTPPTLNTWNHVAATFVNATDALSYYLNGQPDGSTVFTTAPAAGTKTGVVGARTISDGFFQGYIDDAAIYTTALSAASILQNYNYGIGGFTNTVLPTITGNLSVGSTLTVNAGTWQPTPASYSYYWHRADDAVGLNLAEIGATGATYTLSTSDLNKYLRAGVIPSR